MNAFIKNISAIALAAGIVALPGAANAATLTTTTIVTLNVTDQCSLTGADVNLGTYSVNQKWSDVAALLGSYSAASGFIPGSLGFDYLNLGSVTCVNNVPYTLKISGSGATNERLQIVIGGKVAAFSIYVKKLGGVTVADNNAAVAPGAGTLVNIGGVTGTGTGVKQDVLGNVVQMVGSANTTAALTDVLGVAGTYTDTLKYTLTF